MKSKHKHELQTNELAAYIARIIEWGRPHARLLSYGGAGVLVLIIALVVLPAIKGGAAGRNPAVEAFSEALASGQVQPVRDFLAGYPTSDQAPAAKLILADRLLAEAVRGAQAAPGEDAKANAAKLLAEAKDLYTQIAQSPSAHESLARTGLAMVMIQEGDLDKGLAALKEVTEKWPQELGAQKAKANLEALAGYKPVEFSNEPLEEPKPPAEAKPPEVKPAEAAPAEAPKPAPATEAKPAAPKG
jgi:hypothetical protein